MSKTIARLFLLAGLFAASASRADSDYTPTEAEATKYTVEQARDLVQRGFSRCSQANRWSVAVMPDIVRFTSGGHSWTVQLKDWTGIRASFTDSNAFFSRKRSLLVRLNAKSAYLCDGLPEEWAKQLGDALLGLKLAYDRANNPELMEKFKEQALRYQAMQPKPQIPEEARRFRIQAEAAIEAKRFLEAADKYGNAIELAPWWPEGHFNRAVVLAELENFDSAVAEMKRYLLLKPDAPDARQAQDFIYAWEAHPFRDEPKARKRAKN